MNGSIFRHQDGVLANTVIIVVIHLFFIFGIIAITHKTILVNIAGIYLLTQSLVLTAYFIHELAHNTIFNDKSLNKRLGTLLLWLNGSCYFGFDYVQREHINHHVRRADIILFDYQALILSKSRITFHLVTALEWAYIPVVDIIMRWAGILKPFYHDHDVKAQIRVSNIFIIRCCAFLMLAWISLSAIFYYAVAYLLFIHVLRFLDAHQHTYEVYNKSIDNSLPQIPKRSKEYEQQHSYSNLLSQRWPWINLIVLNFCYHNAHHHNPATPWHSLPALHRQLYPQIQQQILSFPKLIRNYHQNRVKRIFSNDAPAFTPLDWDKKFIGVVGVSFLY